MTPTQIQRFEALVSHLDSFFSSDSFCLEQISRLRASGEDAAVCNALANYFRYPRTPGKTYIGTTFGNYELREKIGAGAYASVYRAREYCSTASTQRDVAIKFVHLEDYSPQRAHLLIHEVKIFYEALGNPPHTIPLLSAGTAICSEQISPYYVTPLVEQGKPLTEYASCHDLSVLRRLALFLDLLDAISYAHSRGVYHGDIKPANVLLDRGGSLFVIDFGLATTNHLINSTLPRGTPAYMAPEQVSNVETEINSKTTDIYSLGVLLYELLADRKPYDVPFSTSIEFIRRAIVEANPPRLGQLSRHYRGPIEHIVAKAMSKDPMERWATVDAFREALQLAMAEMQVGFRFLVLSRTGLMSLATASLSLAAFGYVQNSRTATEVGVLLLRFSLVIGAIWLFIILYHRYMKSLGPIWNSTLLFSMVAGITASVIAGLLYAFSVLPSDEPRDPVTPIWYVRLLRFITVGIVLSFFYGSIFALIAERRNNPTFRITEWVVATWLALSVMLLVTIHYTSRITEIPMGKFLGTTIQGDVRYEVFVLHAGICLFLMATYENWRNIRNPRDERQWTIKEKSFCARVWVALVFMLVSGVPLASLFWGHALTPNDDDLSFAVFTVTLLSAWAFGSYFVLTGQSYLMRWSEVSMMRQFGAHRFCVRWTKRIRRKWKDT